jgi:energy-coupling factor transporter ATP-binding protein EcfA2
MSGGEQQRVALARAAAPRPAILLADEPTGNLDGANGEAIMDLLFGLRDRHGATLVLVTHAPELAARCDRVIRLRDGRIAGRTPCARPRMSLPVSRACGSRGANCAAGCGASASSLPASRWASPPSPRWARCARRSRRAAARGRGLLGGDAEMEFTYRFATEAERGWMAAPTPGGLRDRRFPLHGGGRSRRETERALTQVKAVDGAYPLYGEVGSTRRCRWPRRWRARRPARRGDGAGADRPAGAGAIGDTSGWARRISC